MNKKWCNEANPLADLKKAQEEIANDNRLRDPYWLLISEVDLNTISGLQSLLEANGVFHPKNKHYWMSHGDYKYTQTKDKKVKKEAESAKDTQAIRDFRGF